MKKHFILFLLALSSISLGLFSQTPTPFDSKIKQGKLDNGLTYFIRQNGLPQGQASFYLVQKVGAMQEEDNQNGLAHFLEHMAFGSTKNFPKNVLDAVERSGGKLGPNLNAYTAFDQTVYYLSDIPVKSEGIIDTCLLILHDWSGFINLEADAIDRERKVIKEEWRQRQGSWSRIDEKLKQGILPGSKYAKRSIIGDMDIVENFEYDELRAYYHKWYRPDLQGLIIVGDIDVDDIEKRIRQMFVDVPKPNNPAERIYYDVPDNESPLISVVTDPEARDITLSIQIKHDVVPRSQRKTREYLINQYMTSMVSNMLSARLSEINQKPDAPFGSAYAYYGGFYGTATKDAFTFRASPKEGMINESMNVLITEKERVMKYGFTEGEISRAKTNYMKDYEERAKRKDAEYNSSHVNNILHNFLIDGPIPGIEYEYNLIKEVLPSLGKNEFDKLAVKLLDDSRNLVVSVSGPEKEGLTYPTAAEIIRMFATVKATDIAPYEDSVPEGPLVDRLPPPGNIVSENRIEKYNITEWTLSNGMKIAFKVTDFQPDLIAMSGVGFGGTSLFGDNEILNANYASAVTHIGGVGTFSPQDLKKVLTGKRAMVSANISNQTQGIRGSSSKADLETMFQLMYLNFTSPRKDVEAFEAFKERTRNSYKNRDSNPDTHFNDSIQYALFGNHPRLLIMKEELVDKLNYDRMLEMYKTCFANPGSFVINFSGTIDEDELRPLVEKYLACLPSGNKDIKFMDRDMKPRKGKYEKHFTRKAGEDKAAIFIQYNGFIQRVDTLAFRLHVLNGVLNTTLRDAMRGDAGGVYGVGSHYNTERFPSGKTALTVNFSTDPNRVDEMKGIVYRTLQKFADEGPDDEIFKKEVENQLKNYSSYQRMDGFWNAIMEILCFYHEDENGSVDYQTQIKSVKKEEIQKMVKDLLSQDNVVEVIMVTEKQ